MKPRISTGLTLLLLLLVSSAAQAWMPVVYPIRSQSPYQRSIDTSMCFATANRQSKVNIAHESQLPPRKPAASKSTSTGTPSRPPLPPSSFSAMPMSASMPTAASAPAANAPAASAATATAATAASGTTAATTTTTTAASAATAASSSSAKSGASETAAASAPQTAQGSDVKLPPLPAPEPPMTRYWAAYGACMQARGYVVMQ
ncbi:hypothetical protein [Paraburkholderia lacunae]|uniref:Uncharacterized protein n=1 Tax=Paraburkholderia lacunae TaxID=2211104 RepID=A0A370MZ83_9BURK|nr:hypothetical protein [Paraburkholderia lacunae]RDJ98636.1 hypothetical protein DLM46_32700 [Paraburkholderia lacunae]